MRVTDLLRTMDIFEQLPAEEVEKIARLLRERRLAENDVLCRQGEPGDAMYVVTGGRIRLSTTDPNGNEKVLTYFTDGQFFGETALLTGAPRSATAAAETESRVLVLQKEDFDNLLSNNAQIMREMLKVLSQRTVQTNQQLLAEESGGGSAAGTGRVYAVFSPRGGCGKSTLAVNLAVTLAELMPERAALLDLDLTFGHAGLLLNVLPDAPLSGVAAERLAGFDRQTLSRFLAPHQSGLQLLAGATRPEEGEAVTGEHVRAALGVMKRQFQAIVVDCSGTFNDPTLAALELADKVLVVCTPELNTLRDVRECQRIFGDVIHLDKSRLYYVLNNYQPFRVLARDQFEAALEQPINLEIPHAGEAAMKAALKGEPLVLGSRGSPFAQAIEHLADELTPEEHRPAKGKGRDKPHRVKPVPVSPVAVNGTGSRPRGLMALFRRR